jgi:hypothetical protein
MESIQPISMIQWTSGRGSYLESIALAEMQHCNSEIKDFALSVARSSLPASQAEPYHHPPCCGVGPRAI